MFFSICLYMFYRGTIFNILSENLIAQIYYSWIFHCTFCYPNKANACMMMLVLLLSLHYPIVSSFCCSVKVTGIFVNNFSTKPLFTCHKFHWHSLFFLHYSAPAQLWERANHSLTKLRCTATTTYLLIIAWTMTNLYGSTFSYIQLKSKQKSNQHHLMHYCKISLFCKYISVCSIFLQWWKEIISSLEEIYSSSVHISLTQGLTWMGVRCSLVLFRYSTNCFLSRVYSITLYRTE